MNIIKNNHHHISILDDLRGIAILSVVIYHYFYVFYRKIDSNNIFIQNFNTFNDFLNFGAFGVSLFFIVSGFVIPMSLQGENRRQVVVNFFVKRFFRLYPTYWFAIIMIVSIVFLFKDTNAFSLTQVMINFTMMQDILKAQSIDGVFWTLMIEIKFYVLSAILFYIGILKKINLIILFFLLLSITSLYLGYMDGNRGFGNSILSYLMLMYLGTSFYFYYIKEIEKNTLIYLIFVVVIYYFSNQFFLFDNGYGARSGYSLATILSILIFTIAIQSKKPLSKFTSFFGNISYSFYLLHQVIGYLLISQFLNRDIPSPYAQILTIFIMAIVSLIVFQYIEMPTNRYGHKYVK